jgi:transcriptional regulator with XRE-family HTH domain
LPRPPKEVVLSKEEIGRRLRAVRKARELTQAQLAELLGARSTNVSDIERGERGVTVQQVVKLAKALHVSADEILGLGKSAAGRNGKVPRRMERIRGLPRSKQRVLLEIIDAFLDRHEQERRRSGS